MKAVFIMMNDIPSSIAKQELYHYHYKTLSRHQPICNNFLRFELFLYQFSALKKEKNMFKKVGIPAEAGIQISLS
jgi:hypothetical protein